MSTMYTDNTNYTGMSVSERSTFITRTYAHLLAAILSFVGIEIWIFKNGYASPIAQVLLKSWLITLGAFILIGWIGSKFAATAESKAAQYVGLGLYVIAQAIIFVPMLFIAESMGGGLIESAAQLTAIGFLGLTAIVFTTRKDFSFMRGMLMWGGMVALLIIIASLLFGLELGVWFSVGMVALAGGSILYDTSNVINHYPSDRYVGASLELFASVALLFWYVLRLLMQMRD